MLKLSLQVQILLGFIFGILSGLFFGELCSPLGQIGRGFIMLLKMPILLFMSFSLIYAIASLAIEKSKKMLLRTLLFLSMIWVLSITMVYLAAMIFPTTAQSAHFSILSPEDSLKPFSLIELFIPLNPIHAFTHEIVPAIVVFSLLFGMILMRVPHKGDLLKNLKIVVKALGGITQWVARFSPIGVFALIASSTGTISFHQFEKLQLYLYASIGGMLILSLWILPLLVSSLTPVSKRHFITEMQPAILLAFTTGNVLVALPSLTYGLEQIASRYRINDEDTYNTIESMVPIAYNFPTAGNLFAMLFILFMSFFYAIPFSLTDHLTFVGLGLPALFGSNTVTINAIGFLIDQLHLPLDGLSLFIETMPITRNFQTATTCIGIAVVSLLVTFSMKKQLCFRFKRLLIHTFLLSIVIASIISGVQHWIPYSSTGKPVFETLSVLDTAPNEWNESPTHRSPSIPLLTQIKSSGILKVGVHPHLLPYAYWNKKKELAGYDIAFAHRLARSLNCKIEFIPFEFKDLVQDLEMHRFDIAMSGISISEKRIETLLFSTPYLTSERVLLSLDHKRLTMQNYNALQRQFDFRLASLKGSSSEEIAKKYFPHAQQISLSDFNQMLAPNIADALLWTKEEAVNWALRHPRFTATTPYPSLGKEVFAFALPPGDLQWLEYINYWLKLAEIDGFQEGQYNYWILGENTDRRPRWSIIRDVLHWIP